ncbi:hypothetical protein GCM10023208_29220 [Erythrobacter westpacificensis]|uniref:Uncharacterized protein n=1 Tax=Erythrobacter westpacificensis TaxID=1055231 RepID=A0ABP9KKE7_9SPHN
MPVAHKQAKRIEVVAFRTTQFAIAARHGRMHQRADLMGRAHPGRQIGSALEGRKAPVLVWGKSAVAVGIAELQTINRDGVLHAKADFGLDVLDIGVDAATKRQRGSEKQGQ